MVYNENHLLPLYVLSPPLPHPWQCIFFQCLMQSQAKQTGVFLLPFLTQEASHCPLEAELRFSTEPPVLETFPGHHREGVLIHFQQRGIPLCACTIIYVTNPPLLMAMGCFLSLIFFSITVYFHYYVVLALIVQHNGQIIIHFTK